MLFERLNSMAFFGSNLHWLLPSILDPHFEFTLSMISMSWTPNAVSFIVVAVHDVKGAAVQVVFHHHIGGIQYSCWCVCVCV